MHSTLLKISSNKKSKESVTGPKISESAVGIKITPNISEQTKVQPL